MGCGRCDCGGLEDVFGVWWMWWDYGRCGGCGVVMVDAVVVGGGIGAGGCIQFTS